MLGEDSLLYFADVCAGPGGFSEYVLWRKRWRSKGFGFTLKGKSDFKLEDFYAGTRKFEVNRARTVIIVFAEFNLKLSVVGCPIWFFDILSFWSKILHRQWFLKGRKRPM